MKYGPDQNLLGVYYFDNYNILDPRLDHRGVNKTKNTRNSPKLICSLYNQENIFHIVALLTFYVVVTVNT